MPEKIRLEFIGSNGSGTIEGELSLNTTEVERIEVKGKDARLLFPGAIITVPLSFCDEIRKVIQADREKKG